MNSGSGSWTAYHKHSIRIIHLYYYWYCHVTARSTVFCIWFCFPFYTIFLHSLSNLIPKSFCRMRKEILAILYIRSLCLGNWDPLKFLSENRNPRFSSRASQAVSPNGFDLSGRLGICFTSLISAYTVSALNDESGGNYRTASRGVERRRDF